MEVTREVVPQNRKLFKREGNDFSDHLNSDDTFVVVFLSNFFLGCYSIRNEARTNERPVQVSIEKTQTQSFTDNRSRSEKAGTISC